MNIVGKLVLLLALKELKADFIKDQTDIKKSTDFPITGNPVMKFLMRETEDV